ncbi:MAG TPA: hypothetical protein PLR99_19610 [Polyangiaceae bacterium]|nr:hypothetical protein [Polyangiaceae bacterium]
MADGTVMVLFGAFALAHAAPLGGVVVYFREEAKSRAVWQAFPQAAEVLESNAYRSGGAVHTRHLERAPGVVRAAAASCFVMGAMFVPGLAWGLFGLIAAGAGLLSIPGLIIAAWLWLVGFKLLRGDPTGAVSAARAAAVSFYFNVLLILGAAFAAALAGDPLAFDLAALVGTYAVVSILQAGLMAVAAREVSRQYSSVTEDDVSKSLPYALRRLVDRRRARQVREAGFVAE